MQGNDLTIYSTRADEWWQSGSPAFRSLQNLTPFRLSLIREACGELARRRVYDLGCGGGLLSVPLIEEGAILTGIDISAESLKAARNAALGRGVFVQGTITDVPLPSASADVVLLADVLDHVQDYPRALAEASRLLKPGGRVFVGTINRTVASYIMAIILGEGLGFIPKHTHRHNLFITPQELITAGEQAGLRHLRTFGESIAILPTIQRKAVTLRRSASCSVAYSMVFKRRTP